MAAAVSDHEGLNRDSSISGPATLHHCVPCFYVAIMSTSLHLRWRRRVEMNTCPAEAVSRLKLLLLLFRACLFSSSTRFHILKNQMFE